jgi:hypothetical protein
VQAILREAGIEQHGMGILLAGGRCAWQPTVCMHAC